LLGSIESHQASTVRKSATKRDRLFQNGRTHPRMPATAQAKTAAIPPENGPSKNSAAHVHAEEARSGGARSAQRATVVTGRRTSPKEVFIGLLATSK